jgi:hypothetical protein
LEVLYRLSPDGGEATATIGVANTAAAPCYQGRRVVITETATA